MQQYAFQIIQYAFEEEECHEHTIGEMIDKHIKEDNFSYETDKEKRMFQWLYIKKELWSGTILHNMSISTFKNSIKFDGDDLFVREGHEAIVNHFSHILEEKIRLNTVVSKIEYGGKKVKVHTNKGVLECDRIIVTVPLGVLQARSIEFSPPLPQEKSRLIDSLGMGVVNKVALLFDELFWPENISAINYVSDKRGEFPYFLNLYPLHKKPVLVCFTSGPFAKEIEELSDEEIISKITHKLLLMFPTAKRPSHFLITRWGKDPHTLGSYSYLGKGTTGEECSLLAEPLDEKIFFAGEHTHQENRSTTSGAYLSGIEAARKVLSFLK